MKNLEKFVTIAKEREYAFRNHVLYLGKYNILQTLYLVKIKMIDCYMLNRGFN